MRKGDLIWLAAFGAVATFLLLPATHELFVAFTATHAYISGFIKFLILASMGELLALRIVTGTWSLPDGMIYRSLIWGILGMAVVLVFNVYAAGVKGAMASGILPGGESTFLFAFFVSTIMNMTYGPAMMIFHRFTDTFIDLKHEQKDKKITLNDIVERIDWNGFFSFVICKTLPMFWIPAHTLTFLLPPVYRVIAAAFLSIALGAILAFAKKNKKTIVPNRA